MRSLRTQHHAPGHNGHDFVDFSTVITGAEVVDNLSPGFVESVSLQDDVLAGCYQSYRDSDVSARLSTEAIKVVAFCYHLCYINLSFSKRVYPPDVTGYITATIYTYIPVYRLYRHYTSGEVPGT